MSYVLLVFFYLLATAMWLAFTELWSKKGAIILWWILAVNFVKDTIAPIFNQWFKGLMGTPANLQKNRDLARLYYAAREFVHLSFEQKFHVGFQMGLCDHYDAMRNENDLEEYIFGKVIRDRVLDEFMVVVRRNQHDQQG